MHTLCALRYIKTHPVLEKTKLKPQKNHDGGLHLIAKKSTNQMPSRWKVGVEEDLLKS